MRATTWDAYDPSAKLYPGTRGARQSGSRGLTGLPAQLTDAARGIRAIGIGGRVAPSPLPHHQDMRVRIRRFSSVELKCFKHWVEDSHLQAIEHVLLEPTPVE